MRCHLGGSIQVCPTEAEGAAARRRERLAESEIGQFRGGGGEEEILRLDVAMENVLRVEFADGDDERRGDGAQRGVRFGERHRGLDAEEGVGGAAERGVGHCGAGGSGRYVLEEGKGLGFGCGKLERDRVVTRGCTGVEGVV